MKIPFKLLVLAVPLVLLGACAPDDTPDVSLTDIAQAAARQDDQVNVRDLATWLIEGRRDFRLIDVRLPEHHARGSIGDAENIPITQLFNRETIDGLGSDRKIILYSNGSQNAAKASVGLRLSGINAHVLNGGYNAWQQHIINPDISPVATDGENPLVSEQRAYACHFVGEREGVAKLDNADVPFVPPVFVEPEQTGTALPPPAAEEGC
jgi:rhodanese-related sulfurtransferase